MRKVARRLRKVFLRIVVCRKVIFVWSDYLTGVFDTASEYGSEDHLNILEE